MLQEDDINQNSCEGRQETSVHNLRPSQCRAFMRRKLAAAFPCIVQGFVREAASGSCAHVKLASELLEPAPRKLAARKGSAQKLLEKLGGETQTHI